MKPIQHSLYFLIDKKNILYFFAPSSTPQNQRPARYRTRLPAKGPPKRYERTVSPSPAKEGQKPHPHDGTSQEEFELPPVPTEGRG
jgi:hypothetical protein